MKKGRQEPSAGAFNPENLSENSNYQERRPMSGGGGGVKEMSIIIGICPLRTKATHHLNH